jgi:hypothetical protein
LTVSVAPRAPSPTFEESDLEPARFHSQERWVGLQRKTEGLRTSGIHEWKDYEVKDLHARQHVDERLRIASANRPRTAQIDPARHEHVHPSVAHPGVDPRDTKEVEPSYVHDRWCHPSVSMAEIRSRAASGYVDARRSGAQRLLAVSQSSDALVRERTSKQQALEIEASNNLHRRHTIEVVQNKATKASKQHQVTSSLLSPLSSLFSPLSSLLSPLSSLLSPLSSPLLSSHLTPPTPYMAGRRHQE